MAGRRIIDAAKLFNASKAIAKQHINLRSQQLDVYNRTSALAKAAKSQTDRITLTAEAAIALSKRFSEDLPSYAQAAAPQAPGTRRDHIPRNETVKGSRPYEDIREGLEQDHHYDRSARNSETDPVPENALDIQQEEAKHRPLPDGTIPTTGVTWEGDVQGQDTFTEPSPAELSKKPLAEEHHQKDVREDEGLRPVGSNASTIPEPDHPPEVADKEKIPERVNTDVFRTKRVAKMLGGNPYARKEDPYTKTKIDVPGGNAQNTAARSQDASSIQRSRPESSLSAGLPQSNQSTAEKEIHGLASQIAEHVKAAKLPESEVDPTM